MGELTKRQKRKLKTWADGANRESVTDAPVFIRDRSQDEPTLRELEKLEGALERVRKAVYPYDRGLASRVSGYKTHVTELSADQAELNRDKIQDGRTALVDAAKYASEIDTQAFRKARTDALRITDALFNERAR